MGVELHGSGDVRVLPAPLVEGLVVALVMAAAGASLETVADEASNALVPKLSALGQG